MSRVNALFNPRQRSRLAPITTRDPARYPAWERPLEEQYLQTLLTNTLGNTFYVSSKDLLKESHTIHDRMMAEDPEFATKALGYGRNKGFMRTQPVFGLAKLFMTDKDRFKRAFGQVVRTPNDLRDFITILCSLGWNKSGKCVKRTAGRWLAQKLGEYWAIKYGASKVGEWSIRDLMIILHPKRMRSDLADYMMGRETNLEELPQIAAFEALKKATDAKEKVRLITEGRLPHEVASTFAGKDTEVWDAIAPQMPIFALLRNLATLERHGVLDNHREMVQRKFNDPEVIGKSKILPFRFLDAIDHVSSPWAQDSLRDALELSFGNLPEIPGRTVVCLDISGSMQGRFLLIGGIFAISLMKKTNYNGRFFLFNHCLHEAKVSMRDSVLSQARTIRSSGSTRTDLIAQWMLQEKFEADNLILITDEQQNQGSPFIDVLNRYRRMVNKKINVFIVDVSPYRTGLLEPNDPAYFIYGWSLQVLNFVSMASRGWGTMAEAIKTDKV